MPKDRAAQKRIREICNRLSLAPIRTAKVIHLCTFCTNFIRPGDQYRAKQPTAYAHETCYRAVSQEFNH